MSVNFGTPVSVKSTLGILNGFDDSNNTGNPPSNLVLPLQPQSWRAGPYDYQQIRAVEPAIPVELIMETGWPPNNYNGLGPPWLDWTAYQSELTASLSPFAPLPANTWFEPWNEPDDGWAAAPGSPAYQGFWSGTAEQFYETYLLAFQTIRSVLGPNAPVSGPTFTTYSHAGIQDFLEYCLANGCEVNSLTWHDEDDSVSPVALGPHVQDALSSFLQNPRYAPLKIQRIDVNEIVGNVFTHEPAGSLAYYGALEASGANADRSCWTLSNGVSECFNGTIGGLLTSDTFQSRAAWWLYESYAAGVGGRVQSATSGSNLVALASSSITSASTPQILIGNYNFNNTVAGTSSPLNVVLSLAGLQTTSIGAATTMDVRVELIPNTGEAAVSQLTLAAEMDAPISGGTAQISLPALQTGEVFLVALAQVQPQAITFGALSNVTYGVSPFPVGATASSGLTVTFASTTASVCTVSGNTVTIVATGICSITASQAGNLGYTAATPVTRSFTVTLAILSITKTHAGSFVQGQTGAAYTVTVSNVAGAGATSGTVTVTETAPQSLTLVSMAGTGWTCPSTGTTCTRSDALAAGASYPAITATVNVATNASTPQVNAVSVSGGGSANASATDSTTIVLNLATTYLVGDVAPYASDTAPGFGDGILNILDLIQELFAVNNIPGFRPAACSDRFDAMDLYPADATSTRGGDGALDIRDLILELFRVNNLDPARPVRTSLGGALPWTACAGESSGNSISATKVSRNSVALPRPQVSAQGTLVLGFPEQSSGGGERVPVYLEAKQDLLRVAVTFGLGDQQSQLRFVATPETPPSLAEDSQLGVVAAAWVNGVSVPAGERLLLGYVTGPAGLSANLRVYGASAGGVGDNREVRLDASTPAGPRQ